MALRRVVPSRSTDERVATVERLHRQYAGVIFDLCNDMLKDRAEAEDAVQETFVRAFRFHDKFSHGETRLPWLYRIASNVCISKMRGVGRKRLVFNSDTADYVLERVSRDVNTDRRMDAERVVEEILQGEDERGRQILVGHYLGGMSQQEVAEMLGISRRAVVKRLTAFKKRLVKMGHKEEESSE